MDTVVIGNGEMGERMREALATGCINSAAYYDQHADRYIEDTDSIDLSPLYKRFLAHLPAHARILDAGCGSGRDSMAFNRLGHDVVATDASPAMVRHASRALGQEVLHLRHEDIRFEEAFDGIWSNASLLHSRRPIFRRYSAGCERRSSTVESCSPRSSSVRARCTAASGCSAIPPRNHSRP